MADRVLIDTCIWASVFAKPGSREHHTAERLIEEIQVEAGGTVVAVLSRPRDSGDFQAYWRQREAALSAIRLSGTWESGEAISADRERP